MHALRFALVVALCAAAQGAVVPISESELRGFGLHEVLDNTFRARGLGAVWTGNNTLAKFNSQTREIQQCDPNTFQCVVLVKNTSLDDVHLTNIGSWTLSSDMKLLLWSYNVTAGFRHSTQAQYAVLNIATSEWHELHGGRHLQIAQFAPSGTGVAYVMENRVYYAPNVLLSAIGTKIKVADDSNKDIYYGVPDWVYEEEVLGSGSAMWISKNGSFMAFGKFDDSNVRNFSYITYGTDQYTNVETLNYPKPGTSNPVVALQIANLTNLDEKLEVLNPPFDESILQTVAWASDNVVVVVWMSRIQNEVAMHSYTRLQNGTWSKHDALLDNESDGWLEIGTPLTASNLSWVQLLPRRVGNERFQRPTVFVNQTVSQHADRTVDKSVATALYGWNEISNRIFFQAAPQGKPGQRHVYSTTASGATPEVRCLTCDVPFGDGENCSYASATFSKDLSLTAVTCSGPGPAVVRLAKVLNNGTLEWGRDWEDNKDVRELLKTRSQPEVLADVFEIGGIKAQVKLWVPPKIVKDGSVQYPMLVYVYGGPGSQQVSEAFSVNWGTYLATSKNIIYAFIDGRGSGFQGTKTLYALYKKLGTVEIEDQISVTNQLIKKYPFIDPQRVGIWGWSYGGYATAMALARDTEGVFQCGASVAPVTSWKLYDSIYTERYMDTPQRNPKGYEEASVLNKARAFSNRSFFLLHGNADDNVHYQQAMQLARQLELENVLFSSQSYPDENHSIRSVINHVYNSLGNFFDQCFVPHNSGPTLIPSLLSTLILALGIKIFI